MILSWLRGPRRTRRRPPTALNLQPLEDRLAPAGLDQINHFVVIYQENWSFDALYGNFPGANGLANAVDASGNLLVPQLDKSGNPLTVLPQPLNSGAPDPRFPAELPVQPYDFTQYVPANGITGDIVHRFYTEQLQINGGLNNQFVTWSDNGGLVLSNVDATNLPEGLLAQQYTIADNFFHASYGGSFLNHQFLVAAAAPYWNQPLPTSSPNFVSSFNPLTGQLNDGNLTTDGLYAVNTTFARNLHPNGVAPDQLLNYLNDVDPSAPDYTPTIGDRLDDAGLSWKWYSGGWDNAVAGHADPLFQFHHQPFAYYARYADEALPGHPHPHLQDENNFYLDLANGTLPAVSFIKPLGPDNEHPGYASLLRGQQHVADLVHAIQNSPDWAQTAVLITYDENGGRWDHVSPPSRDEWGDGVRVPAIIISPYAKQGYVDHEQHDTLSILKTIEERFGLAPLNERDASVSDLSSAFQDTPQASAAKAYLQPDANNPGKSTLVVQGTPGSDRIYVLHTGNPGELAVVFYPGAPPQVLTFNEDDVSRLEVYGGGGNDQVYVYPDVTLPALLFAGAGNSLLEAGGGPTVLVGGGGNSRLVGGTGHDLLIAGLGRSDLFGRSGNDLLIGGTTAYDNNVEALNALLAEWSRTDETYLQQAMNLLLGGADGLNGTFRLNASTVGSNGGDNGLWGVGRGDLYFARLAGEKKDRLGDLGAGEVVINI
jgi:phospholipase C